MSTSNVGFMGSRTTFFFAVPISLCFHKVAGSSAGQMRRKKLQLSNFPKLHFTSFITGYNLIQTVVH